MHKYVVIDDFVTTQKANELMDLIDDMVYEREECDCPDHELQTIVRLPKLANEIWEKTKQHIINSNLYLIKRETKTYKLVGLSDSITISRHNAPIGIHKDVEGEIRYHGIKRNDLLCLYKIALYLNNVNENSKCKAGGTVLYNNDKVEVVSISPKKGKALIFDIRDWHSGAPIPRDMMKYLIGFRLLYREI
jgi:hypothetical protein